MYRHVFARRFLISSNFCYCNERMMVGEMAIERCSKIQYLPFTETYKYIKTQGRFDEINQNFHVVHS